MTPKIDNETIYECYECRGRGHWWAVKNVARIYKNDVRTTVAEAGVKVTCPVCAGRGWLDWTEYARGRRNYAK